MPVDEWKTCKVHIRVIGTRWAHDDLHGDLLDVLPSMVIPAIKDGEISFPTVWTQKRLDEERDVGGSTYFSYQFLLEPIDPDSQLFREEHRTTYETAPDGLSVILTVDLATRLKERADDTAIVASGVDDKGNLYVLGYQHGKWTPTTAAKKVYEMYDLYKARLCYFEDHGYQAAFATILRDYGRTINRFLPIRPQPAKGTKYDRVITLQPLWETGRLRVKKEHTALIDQALRFPRGHDDIIDALSIRTQRMVWAQTTPEAKPKPEPGTFGAVEAEIERTARMKGPGAAVAQPIGHRATTYRRFWPRLK
jgi:predicted phage terminase large subunit-like protein